MIKELSVFIDNKPGRLKAVTGAISEDGINIRAISIQSKDNFGLMKIIVDNPEKAYLSLNEKGFACAVKNIIAVQFEDKVGGLDEVLAVFYENDINICDSFAFVLESGHKAVFCVEIEDGDITDIKNIFNNKGFLLLEDKDLYGL